MAQSPKPIKDQQWYYLNQPAVLSILAFVAIVIFFSLQMRTQMQAFDFSPNAKAFETLVTLTGMDKDSLPPTDSARISLEYDVLQLRYKLIQSMVSSRLFLQTLALMSGLALIIIGCSFVFARIETAQTTAKGKDGKGKEFELTTTVPGLVLAGFGAIVIISILTTTVFATIKSVDSPTYLNRYVSPNTQAAQNPVDAKKRIEADIEAALKGEQP